VIDRRRGWVWLAMFLAGLFFWIVVGVWIWEVVK
jgi:hypothetical protein